MTEEPKKSWTSIKPEQFKDFSKDMIIALAEIAPKTFAERATILFTAEYFGSLIGLKTVVKENIILENIDSFISATQASSREQIYAIEQGKPNYDKLDAEHFVSRLEFMNMIRAKLIACYEKHRSVDSRPNREHRGHEQ